tara:strand:+ start:113 stop:442 length:330 start_codon:yes stop_codon:yes gene_type:complete
MKITKSQLKQIIKEELAEATSRIVSPMTGEEHWVEDEEKTPDQMTLDKVEEVTILFADLYKGLPDDESKELFEHWLNANIRVYTQRWQEERSAGPEDWRSDPDLPEELP